MEYADLALTPSPELSEEQMVIVHKGFGSLLVGLGFMFMFGVMVIFLFRLLGGKGLK